MEYINLFTIAVGFWILSLLKGWIWDAPRDEIKRLKSEKEVERKNHQNELLLMQKDCQKEINSIRDENVRIKNDYQKILSTLKEFESNMTAIPFMAGMMADIETYGLEKLALGLSWGHSQKRLDKVKSIRDIRKDAKAMVEKNKDAQYQLAYLLELFPNLADIIECDFRQLPTVTVTELSDYDSTRDYLSKEEYAKLSVTERNQLALDRYFQSHNKTKWQIGRDYE